MRFSATARASVLLLALSTVLVPGALAHAYLDASNPAPNGVTANGTQVLALGFTEVVDPDHMRVSLEGPAGPVQPSDLDVPSDRPSVLRVEVDPLEPGAYRLEWTSFSIDGHVDRGRLAFTVGDAPLGEPIEPEARQAGLIDPTLSGLETVGRLLFLLGALVAFGLPVYTSEVEPDEVVPAVTVRLLAAAGLAGALGALVLTGVLIGRLEASTAAALSTLPGLFLVGKTVALAAVAGIAFHLRGSEHTPSRRLLLGAVLPAGIALVLHSMGGHGVLAATSKESAAGHVAMTVHLAAGGLWLGGLVGLLATVRGIEGLVRRIRAFTPLAIASVLSLGATGLVQAYVHLPSVSALWSSGFGWALVVKTCLFGIVLAFGAWHGFVLPGRLEDGRSEEGSFTRSGRTEAFVLGGVVLAASVMGVLPVPDEGVELEEGPRAVFEEPRQLPGHEYRVVLVDDPIRAGVPIPVELLVRSTSSADLEDASVQARLSGPGNETVDVDLAPEEPGEPSNVERTWRADPIVFPSSGSWTLSLEMALANGNVTERIPVRVLSAR